jgi:hypothetical protein
VESKVFSRIVDPDAKAGPLAQQRLVGWFGCIALHEDEPGGDEALNDGVGLPGLPEWRQLFACDAPSGISEAFAGFDHSQKQRSQDFTVALVESFEQLLGGLDKRTAHPARRPVGGKGEGAAFAAGPGLAQGMGHQGQHAGLGLRVGQDHLGEAGFERQPPDLRGLLDGATKLVAAQRSEKDVVGRDLGPEAWHVGEASIEVGAHRDQASCGVLDDSIGERGPFVGVVTEREDLLELVNDQWP